MTDKIMMMNAATKIQFAAFNLPISSRIGFAETSATTSKAVNASVFRYILFQNRLFAHWFEIKASAEQIAHHTRQITSMITKDGLAFAKNAAIDTLFCSGIFQSIAAVTPKSRYRTPDLIKLSWNCFGTICDIMTLPIAPKPAKNAVAIKNANNHSSICAVVNIVKLPFFFSLAKHPFFAEAALQGLYSNCLYVSLLNS